MFKGFRGFRFRGLQVSSLERLEGLGVSGLGFTV